MTQTFQRDRFTWLVYLIFAFYAYFLNILGPITPFLKDELSLSYTVSSLHFTAFAVGMLLVGLGGQLLIARIGPLRALWLGAFGMSASVLLLMAGRWEVVTIGASFCMGMIGSLILVITPSALSERHGELRTVALTELNVIASLASMAAPLMVGWSAPLPGGWRLALGIAAFIPLLVWLGFGRATAPASVSQPEDPASSRQPLPRMFWVFWAALVLAVSIEFCMIFWGADYLEKSLGMSKTDAARAVSLFLAAMIVGRLAGSRLVQRFAARSVVIASIVTAGIGFFFFWTAGTPVQGLAGLFITGLGVANLYPIIISLAMSAAGNNTVQAGARATLASGTAILALPLVLGRLADGFGIRPAYGVVGVLLIVVFLIMLATAGKAADSRPG